MTLDTSDIFIFPLRTLRPAAHTSDDLPHQAREELALLEQIAAMEAEFVHRRAPPLLRAPALVARWRRLQQGEAFELLSGADGRGWGSPVWVSLSSDLSRLEIARSRGGAVLHIVRLGGVVHLVFGEDACALIRAATPLIASDCL